MCMFLMLSMSTHTWDKGGLIIKKDIWSIVGIILGFVAIIAGIIFLFGFKDETFLGIYSHLGTSEFGGDFYTYSYRATAFAANAVAGVYEMLSTCFGVLFILFGLFDICFFGSRMLAKTKKQTSSISEDCE